MTMNKSLISVLAGVLHTDELRVWKMAEELHLFPENCGRFNGGTCHTNRVVGTGYERKIVCNGRNGECVLHSFIEQSHAIIRAQKIVKSGEFTAYWRRKDAEENTRNALDRVQRAWDATYIKTMYDWRKTIKEQPDFSWEDFRLSEIDAKMCAAHQTVEDAIIEKVDVIDLETIMVIALVNIQLLADEIKKSPKAKAA